MSEWSVVRIGEVVELNSGGPPMIVECVVSARKVCCSWRTEDGLVAAAEFDERMLMPYGQYRSSQ